MAESKPGFVDTIRSFPRTFWVANTMEIFERMAWYGFFAVSSLYITGPKETGGLGFTSEERGQLQAIVPFILYLLPVVTGALADRYGYKKMFLIAYTGMVISYYALGQFATFPTFLAAFLAVALFAAIFKPVVVGTVARVTNAGNSSMGFGIFYMMVNVGGFVGPLVAGVVRGIAWKYVFLACAGWAAVNLVIVSLFYKDPSTEASSGQKRTLGKVARDMVEVLGNVRFGVCVFVVLIALMVANQGKAWFTWNHCLWFVPIWLAFNFIWDFAMPPGSGNPNHPASKGRGFYAKRMHCSNWRFALYLLILSGFWTSFNQIFLTTPEYIRDYTDTKPMVSAARSVFDAIGRPQWIDGLAAIEESEVMAEFDTLVRRVSGAELLTDAAANNEHAPLTGGGQKDPLASERSLTEADRRDLATMAQRLNKPDAKTPIRAVDLVQAAKSMLQYKVRMTPVEIGELVEKSLGAPLSPTEADLASAVAAVNRRMALKFKPEFKDAEVDGLRSTLKELLTKHGRLAPKSALQERVAALSTEKRALGVDDLAVGVRDAAYRPVIWSRIDAGRQVNPEHIVNFDALAIVLLQVFISFIMSKFHRFTTMIVGMVIAAVGIGLPVIGSGTMIGAVGGSFAVVALGIVIFAVGEMMASPTSQEYVGRIAPKDRVAVYMGYYFVAVALGNLFGGILSGQLYGKLARDMQRPDLMWLAFGGLMLLTAIVFLLYNKFALPRDANEGPEAATA